MGKILIKNCRLYNSINSVTDLLIENSIIKTIGKVEDSDAEIIDAEGLILSPGLIDIHIQGAGGSDILDGDYNAIANINKTLAKLGTTSYLGTTVVKPNANNEHLKAVKEFVNRETGGAVLLGFHLEGPFINVVKKGGLSPDSIYDSSKEKLDEILTLLNGTLKMMTIAPELPGNLEIIKDLVRNNVIAAIAHSNANYEETQQGFKAGINHVTHIFNAMPSLHHRAPGPIAAIFDNKNISAQIISDGHHLHPSIVNLIYNQIGLDNCICITDGMHGIGLPEGKYQYNGKEYESKNGAAKYLDGTLIGSTMSLWQIVLKFKTFTRCSLEDAIKTASRNPAKLLKLYNKVGSIEEGKQADLFLFNEDYFITYTIVRGRLISSIQK